MSGWSSTAASGPRTLQENEENMDKYEKNGSQTTYSWKHISKVCFFAYSLQTKGLQQGGSNKGACWSHFSLKL